ncbi:MULTISPECIES: DUF4129 domain-containing protein [Maribacter]|uniref:DUF4129 domain-containing protein n=1 Tax=Maribacter flavus TaxID=1658664 RepID=A0ABU7IMM7_9FLAO|nr:MULTISPECIES: DUF4129 domain-containing protein [Maribacter]MDC6406727.1 DUF4129 domain-containing protein [Maribacter sp. PR66]MEE1973831.1 DUF4129 domain-containing protein [Maribacter flavus]
MPKRVLLVLFLFLTDFLLAQQDSLVVQYDTLEIAPVTITDSDLESFRNDPKFDYEVVEKSAPDWWISFKNWLDRIFMRLFEWIFGIEKATGAFNAFLQILPYLLLGILIFILIKFFLNVHARSLMHTKNNNSLVHLSEEEQIIKNENIESLIEKALAEKNYRLAIRYYYLWILRLMTDKEIIQWELQKTNEDYLSEINSTGLKDAFKTTTNFYNYIWYGDFPLDETKYNRVANAFIALKKQVSNA